MASHVGLAPRACCVLFSPVPGSYEEVAHGKSNEGRQRSVPLEDVVLAQGFEFEALPKLLERRGLVTGGDP